MVVKLTPTAGVKVQVASAAPETFTEAGYNAVGLTWVDVGGFDNVPEIGDGYEMQNFDSVTDGRIPYRGILTAGGGEVSMADDPTDAGQILMKAAFDAAKGSLAERLSYRIVDQNDNFTAAQVLVGSWRRRYGGSNDVVMRQTEVTTIPGTVVEGQLP